MTLHPSHHKILRNDGTETYGPDRVGVDDVGRPLYLNPPDDWSIVCDEGWGIEYVNAYGEYVIVEKP